MLRATADEPVIMGDKARPEDYLDINDGHVVDAAQLRCGVGGGDLMLENKCWYSLVARGSGPDPGCAFHGSGDSTKFSARCTWRACELRQLG